MPDSPPLPGEDLDEVVRLRQRLADLEADAAAAEEAWNRLTTAITGRGPTDLDEALAIVAAFHTYEAPSWP